MSCRGFGVSIIIALLAAATPAAANDMLKPVKPWIVDYDTAECHAERAYGNEADPKTLAFRPSPWGNTYELLLATKGDGPHYAEELEGSVDFGKGPIKAWLLHYGVKGPPALNIIKFRITSEQMGQAKTAATVSLRVGGRPDATFSLASVPALMAKLDECTADLQHYWNMVDPEQKVIAAPAVGDVRGIFRWTDYPAEAASREQEGSVQFLLFVDEQAKVAACHVLQPSGAPAFDGMGCQVITQRAKFKPALDRAGRPVRSAIVTPPVVWRLSP